jgi:hypothetical protein
MEPSSLSAEDFFKRWRQIGGPPLEAQNTFGLSGKNKIINESFTRQMVEGFGWKILDGVDPNPKNIVGCAVFQFEGGKTGCLLRLEPNYEKSVYTSSLDTFYMILTVPRCTGLPSVPPRKASRKEWPDRWSRSCRKEQPRWIEWTDTSNKGDCRVEHACV